jgi:Ca2+-binding RTX toxin-like protein
VGTNDTVTVGKGQDTFIFDQTTAGSIQAVKITGFDPSKDVIQLTTTLVPSQNVLPTHDDAQGNAVITVDNSGDTITLVGVHSSALHASDFHFV